MVRGLAGFSLRYAPLASLVRWKMQPPPTESSFPLSAVRGCCDFCCLDLVASQMSPACATAGGCGGRGLHAEGKVWSFGDTANWQVWGDSSASGGLRREVLRPCICPVHCRLLSGSLKAVTEETSSAGIKLVGGHQREAATRQVVNSLCSQGFSEPI